MKPKRIDVFSYDDPRVLILDVMQRKKLTYRGFIKRHGDLISLSALAAYLRGARRKERCVVNLKLATFVKLLRALALSDEEVYLCLLLRSQWEAANSAEGEKFIGEYVKGLIKSYTQEISVPVAPKVNLFR